jgi:N-acyl-D-aspartate/D-glutamate deacylase
MAIFKKLFGKDKKTAPTDTDLKAAVLKKATENMDAISAASASQDKVANKNMPAYETNDKNKKNNIRLVLLEIAERGEAGVLAMSISDKIGVGKLDTSNALSFLTKNNFAEAVNSPVGVKFYLTAAGKKYCLSKEFNSAS